MNIELKIEVRLDDDNKPYIWLNPNNQIFISTVPKDAGKTVKLETIKIVIP